RRTSGQHPLLRNIGSGSRRRNSFSFAADVRGSRRFDVSRLDRRPPGPRERERFPAAREQRHQLGYCAERRRRAPLLDENAERDGGKAGEELAFEVTGRDAAQNDTILANGSASSVCSRGCSTRTS
ncbi:MAG: hypothetical protein OEQ13_09355, partial [Acidobacteriota bacterium]|nr:hypothetical protein [Acidobacteriota bacterium]